mgnify:FL=1
MAGENIVVVEIGQGLRLTGRVPASIDWKNGESIQLSIMAPEAHVFAAGPTGRRLNAGDGQP